MDKLLHSNLQSFYSRLDAVRTKHGLTAYNADYADVGDKARSAQMVDLKSKIDSTASESRFLTTKTYDLGNISVGAKILLATKTTIESTLTVFEAACVNYSANYTTNYTSDYANYSNLFPDWSYQHSTNYGDYACGGFYTS